LLFLFYLRPLTFDLKFVFSELLLQVVKLSLESGIFILNVLQISLVLSVDILEKPDFFFSDLYFSRVNALDIWRLLLYAYWVDTLTSPVSLGGR
jgi:hypothetical protein